MADVKQIGRRECVLVLGMHRSGTSAITGSLARAGIALGGDLLAPGKDNPKGYFEHAEAVRIDDALLDALDRHWDDIRPLPQGWAQSAVAAHARDEIREWISGEFATTSLFAIKDPRMCRLVPVWLDALDALAITPKIVLVARPPAEVAASVEKRNGWPAIISETLWLEYMLEAERSTRGRDRVVVTYDRFLKAPVQVLSTALDGIGLAGAANALRAADISGFVSEKDRHHRGGQEMPVAETAIGQLAGEACEAFEASADHPGENPATLDTATYDLLASKLQQVLAPSAAHIEGAARMVMAARRANEGLLVDVAERQSELNAQLEWSEQAIAEREILQAQLAGVRSDLLAQLEWSRQAVLEREKLQAQIATEREALQAELADVSSRLNAQIAWSEHAVEKQEALYVQLHQLQSRLNSHESTWLGRFNRWYLRRMKRVPGFVEDEQ